MDEYVFRCEKITKVFDKQKALDDITLNIKRGDIYGFIGKNGAGKTSLIRIILGLSFPDSGQIELFGETNSKMVNLARGRVGSLIEKPVFYGNMTARENLELIKIQRNIVDNHCIDETLELVGLKNADKKRTKNFSLGMKQRLGIAMALLNKPELLILDEPINGLDPIGIKEIRELLIKINKQNDTTILISSHILSELSQLVSQYGFINEGKLVKEISSTELHRKCRKYINLKVNSTTNIAKVLKNEMCLNDFELCENNVVKVYQKVNLEKLSIILANYNIAVLELFLQEESLEEYFTKLVGGMLYEDVN
jgi:ABC-2 type transport system ATP-binding protein